MLLKSSVKHVSIKILSILAENEDYFTYTYISKEDLMNFVLECSLTEIWIVFYYNNSLFSLNTVVGSSTSNINMVFENLNTKLF